MQAIIDEKGIPQEPRLQEKGDPLLGFVLMWSFRYWRFEPATLDGEPVPFVFDFEVTFKLPRCN